MSHNNLNDRKLSTDQQLEIYAVQKEAEKQAKIAKQQETQQTLQNLAAKRAILLAQIEQQAITLDFEAATGEFSEEIDFALDEDPQAAEFDHDTEEEVSDWSEEIPEPIFPVESTKPKYDPNAFDRFNPADNANELLDTLYSLPDYLAVIPVIEKRPCYGREPLNKGYMKDWAQTKATPQYREEVANYIRGISLLKRAAVPGKDYYTPFDQYKCYASGYGIVSGEASGNLINFDIDGHSAEVFFKALSNGDEPKTVEWTSGKPGRRQLYYRIPSHKTELLKGLKNFSVKMIKCFDDIPKEATKLIPLEKLGFGTPDQELRDRAKRGEFSQYFECAKGKDDKYKEALEIRFNGRQSILPPSRHPTTGRYKWINSFSDCEVADAPEWVITLLEAYVAEIKNSEVEKAERKRQAQAKLELIKAERLASGKPLTETDDLEIALLTAFETLGWENIFNWAGHDWKENRGEWIHGSCPQHASESGTAFGVNLSTGGWTCHGCGIGGSIVQYRSFRKTGDARPRKSDWWEYTNELFNEAGIRYVRPQSKRSYANDVAQVDFISEDAPLPEPNQVDLEFPDEPTSEKVLTKEEFEAKNKKVKLTEQEQQDKIIAQAMAAELKAAEDTQKLNKYFEQYSIKNQKVHKYFECNERYLSDETFAEFPSIQHCQLEGQILGLKAPKGTGKSYRIKEYIKQAKKAGWLIVSVTPRRVLGQSQAKEWGISWIADDGMQKFTNGEVNTMSCCWDSLHKLRTKDYGNKPVLLIIDEVESGLEHITLSNTCKNFRAKIFQQLRRITTHIANHGGLILCADADMSNVSIDYLQTISRDIKTTIIDNVFQEKKKRLIIYYGKPGEVKFRIKEAIEEGTQFLFACDSKKDVDTMYRWTMDYLKKKHKTKLKDKFWHLTSDTVIKEENVKRMLDINGAIKREKPFAIFFTPTLSVGTSIDASHFMEGFGIFKSAVLPDSARQMIARQREFIPWTVFADNMIHNDRKSADVPTQPLLIKKQLYRHLSDQELVTQKIEEMLARQGRPIDELEEAEYSQARVELSKLLQTDYRSIDTAECQLFACLRARENFQLQNYFEVFRAGMIKEGWKVTVLKGSKTGYCDELKELTLKMIEEESLAIADSDCSDIPNAEVAAQLLQESSDPVVRNSCKKFQVSDMTSLAPHHVDVELVKKVLYTSGRWMRAVRYQWLYENPNICKLLAEKKMKKYAKELLDTGIGCPHDAVHLAPEIEQIRKFGIFDLVDLDDPDKKYCKKDIVVLMDKAGLKFFKESDRVSWCGKLGIPATSRKVFFRSPIQYILKPILAKMGYSLEEAARGHSDTYYRIPKEELMDFQRDQVKDAMHQKHLQSETDRALRLASNSPLLLKSELESTALQPA